MLPTQVRARTGAISNQILALWSSGQFDEAFAQIHDRKLVMACGPLQVTDITGELEILEQADAPMITIEMVVRGVQARLDDQAEPERLGADELRTALVEGVWTTPAR